MYRSVHNCQAPNFQKFCKCSSFFPYEAFSVVHILAAVVFTGIVFLYSATCHKIYISREMRTNVNHFIQVCLTRHGDVTVTS